MQNPVPAPARPAPSPQPPAPRRCIHGVAYGCNRCVEAHQRMIDAIRRGDCSFSAGRLAR